MTEVFFQTAKKRAAEGPIAYPQSALDFIHSRHVAAVCMTGSAAVSPNWRSISRTIGGIPTEAAELLHITHSFNWPSR